jgi:hypothetical protein
MATGTCSATALGSSLFCVTQDLSGGRATVVVSDCALLNAVLGLKLRLGSRPPWGCSTVGHEPALPRQTFGVGRHGHSEGRCAIEGEAPAWKCNDNRHVWREPAVGTAELAFARMGCIAVRGSHERARNRAGCAESRWRWTMRLDASQEANH